MGCWLGFWPETWIFQKWWKEFLNGMIGKNLWSLYYKKEDGTKEWWQSYQSIHFVFIRRSLITALNLLLFSEKWKATWGKNWQFSPLFQVFSPSEYSKPSTFLLCSLLKRTRKIKGFFTTQIQCNSDPLKYFGLICLDNAFKLFVYYACSHRFTYNLLSKERKTNFSNNTNKKWDRTNILSTKK